MEGLFHSRYVLINRILSNITANKIQEVQVEFLQQSQVLYKLKSCQQVPTNWKTEKSCRRHERMSWWQPSNEFYRPFYMPRAPKKKRTLTHARSTTKNMSQTKNYDVHNILLELTVNIQSTADLGWHNYKVSGQSFIPQRKNKEYFIIVAGSIKKQSNFLSKPTPIMSSLKSSRGKNLIG